MWAYRRKVPSPPQSLPNLLPTLRQATSARCILARGTLEAAYRRLSWVSEADDTRRTQAASQYTVCGSHLRLRELRHDNGTQHQTAGIRLASAGKAGRYRLNVPYHSNPYPAPPWRGVLVKGGESVNRRLG